MLYLRRWISKGEIFRKSTHTDKYLDFASYHPNQHQHSVIRSLVHRAVTLSDGNNVRDESNHSKSNF